MLEFFKSKPDQSEPIVEEIPDIRYGMYKNLAVGTVKYIQPKLSGKRRHMLIGGIEMTNIKDGLVRATMNRYIYVPDSYDITSAAVGRWCLYGYYVWSNKVPSTGPNQFLYNNILTLRHFELLKDDNEANDVALQIMDSITNINYLKQNK